MSTSPDLPPPAGPQTPAALVIDNLPPLRPPKPPLFIPQTEWDVLKMSREQIQDLQRFQLELDNYAIELDMHISEQVAKVITKIITDLEGYAPTSEEYLTHVYRFTQTGEQPADLYCWKGKAILRTSFNYQITEAHPSPTMDLQILV